jgi:hypothetical protein
MATVPGEGRDFGCINCWFFCEIFLPFNSPEKFLITWRATFVPHPSDLSGSTGIAVVSGGQDWPKNFWRVTHRGDFIANDQSVLSPMLSPNLFGKESSCGPARAHEALSFPGLWTHDVSNRGNPRMRPAAYCRT